MALNREDILKHAGMFDPQEVHVPAWKNGAGDDVVLVRGLTAREFDVHQARVQRQGADDKEPAANLTASLVVRCIVDDSGKRLFTDADINVLGELPAGDLNRITNVIAEQSGLTDEAEKAIEGNSEAAQGGNSSSS